MRGLTRISIDVVIVLSAGAKHERRPSQDPRGLVLSPAMSRYQASLLEA